MSVPAGPAADAADALERHGISASTTLSLNDITVSLDAAPEPEGIIRAMVTCNGQSVVLRFGGSNVDMEVMGT
jgi:hypothetical protein